MTVDLILVPQGAEYNSVVQGLKQQTTNKEKEKELKTCKPLVYPIPIGVHAVSSLKTLVQDDSSLLSMDWQGKTVILMGLGGSLSPQYRVGDIVIPRSISTAKRTLPMDSCGNDSRLEDSTAYPATLFNRYVTAPSLVNELYQALNRRTVQMSSSVKVGLAHGVTSDRIITTPQEKQQLADRYDAELVDMEGAHVLHFLQQRGANVAMVRVISDGCDRTIPDLNSAIDSNGNLDTGRMMMQFLRQPRAAMHLIQGSLKGLNGLKLIAPCCASV